MSDVGADHAAACDDEIATWKHLAYAALSLTLVNFVVFKALVKDRTKWALLWRVTVFLGCAKILAGTVLVAVIPGRCQISRGTAVLPAVCILLGVYGLFRGLKVKKLSEASEAGVPVVSGGTAGTATDAGAAGSDTGAEAANALARPPPLTPPRGLQSLLAPKPTQQQQHTVLPQSDESLGVDESTEIDEAAPLTPAAADGEGADGAA